MMTLTGTLLLTDDSESDRMLYRLLLRGQDVKLIEAESVGETLRLLEEQTFDWVITDHRLADGDGTDVVRAARSSQRNRDALVLVSTGFDAGEIDDQVREAGANLIASKDNMLMKRQLVPFLLAHRKHVA